MYYDVIIEGNHYDILDEKQLQVTMTREVISLSNYTTEFSLPSRMDNSIELNMSYYRNFDLVSLFETKYKMLSNNDFAFNNIKFDILLSKYEMLSDHYIFDYGDLLLGEMELYGCFIEAIEIGYDIRKVKLRFDYLNTTNYF